MWKPVMKYRWRQCLLVHLLKLVYKVCVRRMNDSEEIKTIIVIIVLICSNTRHIDINNRCFKTITANHAVVQYVGFEKRPLQVLFSNWGEEGVCLRQWWGICCMKCIVKSYLLTFIEWFFHIFWGFISCTNIHKE